jgi:lysophospholipase L1-like esterase
LNLPQLAGAKENRFELWFSKGRFRRLLVILVLLVVWLLCDSLLAVVMVKTGHAKREDFFATSLLSFNTADHLDIPEIRDLLARHARLYPRYLDRFQADGLLGGRLVPNFLLIMPPLRRNGSADTNGVEKPFWLMTDEQGFPPVARVGHHYLVQKPADVFRVIMLGGSTVEGIGVSSPLESLPSKLQLLLEREFPQSSKQIEVINAGISGFSSDQEYLFLITDLLRYKPDLVIAYDGWNDAHILRQAIEGGPRTRPYRTVSQANNADRVNASFSPSGSFGLFATITAGRTLEYLRHFATFRLVHSSIRRITDRVDRMNNPARHDPAFRPEPSVEAAHFYIENRERMLFIAKQSGFHFASFLQPIVGIDGKSYTATESRFVAHLHPQIANDLIKQEREVFYQTVRPLLGEFAAANEVHGAFCMADISSSSFAGVTDTVYVDSGHLLAKGNEFVAQRILAELKRCNLLPL